MTGKTNDRAAAVSAMRERVTHTARAARLQRLADDTRLRGDLDETLAELPNPDDVLSIDVRSTVDVLLTCGGPTVFVRYWFGDGEFIRAEWHTTDTPSGSTVSIDLSDDEAESLADAYCGGVEVLAARAGGER